MKHDFRKYRPIILHDQKSNKTISLNDVEIYNIKNTKIEFDTPNVITMFINISHKEFLKATKIFDESIEPLINTNSTCKFEQENLSILYDYFESIQVSLIFAYNSIEAFVNQSIPDNYTYQNRNNKGINEVWDKEAIQKWMSTSDKLIKILPELKQVPNPNSQPFWSDFKKLENLRNEIIHPKTLSKELNVRNEIHKDFFDNNIFKLIKSTKSVLNHFCKGEYSERYIPIGIGSQKTEITELDDFDNYFEEIIE
jgi:hypothetical protein